MSDLSLALLVGINLKPLSHTNRLAHHCTPRQNKPPIVCRLRLVKIQHVAQKHDKGCVVACIAMVLGWGYDEVVTEFDNDFDKKGISAEFAKDFICEHGYSVIERRGTHYLDVRSHNQRMMVPFAPVHIVTVRQYIDLPKHSHAVVMDAKGRIYDPGDKDAQTIIYYSVEHIMGFFDDRQTVARKRKSKK